MTAVLTTAAPASMAAAAQAEAIRMALPSSTPSSTRSRPGTLAWTSVRKAAHSSGVITPAESHRVTAWAPEATAAARTWSRKSPSARVASRAENSTCSV